MKKYGFFYSIRKANPYRKMSKVTQTSIYGNNKVQRKCWSYRRRELLTIDITYMYYCLIAIKKSIY